MKTPISLEDHAWMRVSGKITHQLDCTCNEYAHLILELRAEIERLKDERTQQTIDELSQCMKI